MAEVKKAGASAVSGSEKKTVRKKATAKRKTVAKKAVSRKSVSKKTVAKKSVAKADAKKTATTRKTQRKKLSIDKRRRLIAEAAYLKAERREFDGGDPIEDWLEAETEIDRSQTD
jgi:hypothetical protein